MVTTVLFPPWPMVHLYGGMKKGGLSSCSTVPLAIQVPESFSACTVTVRMHCNASTDGLPTDPDGLDRN